MRTITLFSILACLLLAAPTVVAQPDLSVATAAPPCQSATTMGAVPYTICMAVYAAEAGTRIVPGLIKTGCELVFGPGNC